MMALDVLLKLCTALVLGGVIGYEREYKGMPAGLRTHILVCIGSSLVQIMSFNLSLKYKGMFGVEPLRLGAQVISGIGFLGAGAILKEGTNIKGLTTAASLWVVACIGLAVGSGLYLEAVFSTALILISLTLLKKIEEHIAKIKSKMVLQIIGNNRPGLLGNIGEVFGRLGIQILNVKMNYISEETVTMNFILKPQQKDIGREAIIQEMEAIEGIENVKFI